MLHLISVSLHGVCSYWSPFFVMLTVMLKSIRSFHHGTEGCLLDMVTIFSTFCCSTIQQYIRSLVYTIIIDYSLIHYSTSAQISLMSNQTDTLSLSDLTDADKALIHQVLRADLDSTILYFLLHGMHVHFGLGYLCLIAVLHRYIYWSYCSHIVEYL